MRYFAEFFCAEHQVHAMPGIMPVFPNALAVQNSTHLQFLQGDVNVFDGQCLNLGVAFMLLQEPTSAKDVRWGAQ